MTTNSDAHHGPRAARVELPRALVALAALPLLAGTAGLIAPASALMLGGALAIGATLETLMRLTVRGHDRRKADELLLAGKPVPADLAWREDELSGERERMSLARSLRSLLRSLDREIVMTAQVVNRPVARAQRDGLSALAVRLERLERPVAPLGVLRVRALLRDGRSPLFDPTIGADLPDHIQRALQDLEPRR